MKILYVINQISDWSGDSGLVWMSAQLLKKRGHNVSITTTDGNPFTDKDSILEYSKTTQKLSNSFNDDIIINGISIFPVHCICSKFGMFSLNANEVAKKIVKNFDIVHIYSWYHHIGIEFFKVAKNFNVPIVFSAMGTLQDNAQTFYKTQKFLINTLYTKKLIQYASALHSVGFSEIESYLKNGGKEDKIIQIDNGINLEDFKLKNDCDILKKLDMENKQYILFLSRIHPKKGLELLLDSFNELIKINDDINLVIAGTGEKHYFQKIINRVKNQDLINKVKFTGLISHDEKLKLFESATLFILTSISDIHPRAIQEALTMGIPVIISKECDYPEVEQYNAGIIVNLNISEIVNAFKILLNNESLSIISNNAKNLIKEKYLVEDQIIKFEQIYQTILSKK